MKINFLLSVLLFSIGSLVASDDTVSSDVIKREELLAYLKGRLDEYGQNNGKFPADTPSKLLPEHIDELHGYALVGYSGRQGDCQDWSSGFMIFAGQRAMAYGAFVRQKELASSPEKP